MHSRDVQPPRLRAQQPSVGAEQRIPALLYQYMSDMANIPIGAITSYFRDKIQKQPANWLSAAGVSDDWCPFMESKGNATSILNLRSLDMNSGVNGVRSGID